MSLSILIARIIAAIYIASGIGILTGQINFKNITEDFGKSPAFTMVNALRYILK